MLKAAKPDGPRSIPRMRTGRNWLLQLVLDLSCGLKVRHSGAVGLEASYLICSLFRSHDSLSPLSLFGARYSVDAKRPVCRTFG